jgi:hypothetical protein
MLTTPIELESLKFKVKDLKQNNQGKQVETWGGLRGRSALYSITLLMWLKPTIRFSRVSVWVWMSSPQMILSPSLNLSRPQLRPSCWCRPADQHVKVTASGNQFCRGSISYYYGCQPARRKRNISRKKLAVGWWLYLKLDLCTLLINFWQLT